MNNDRNRNELKYVVCLVLALLTNLSSGYAQENKRFFLWNNFQNATVRMKNTAKTIASMNYDVVSGKMMFMDGNTMMEMVNIALVDTISWGDKKFIPFGKRFLQVCQEKNGKVYIDWRFKDVYVGSKGAYDYNTQGYVDKIHLSNNIEANVVSKESDSKDNRVAYGHDVYRMKNDNIYYFDRGGKLVKVKDVKHLKKLFPGHDAAIKQYMNQQKVNMKDAYSVVGLIDYCVGLH